MRNLSFVYLLGCFLSFDFGFVVNSLHQNLILQSDFCLVAHQVVFVVGVVDDVVIYVAVVNAFFSYRLKWYAILSF